MFVKISTKLRYHGFRDEDGKFRLHSVSLCSCQIQSVWGNLWIPISECGIKQAQHYHWCWDTAGCQTESASIARPASQLHTSHICVQGNFLALQWLWQMLDISAIRRNGGNVQCLPMPHQWFSGALGPMPLCCKSCKAAGLWLDDDWSAL